MRKRDMPMQWRVHSRLSSRFPFSVPSESAHPCLTDQHLDFRKSTLLLNYWPRLCPNRRHVQLFGVREAKSSSDELNHIVREALCRCLHGHQWECRPEFTNNTRHQRTERSRAQISQENYSPSLCAPCAAPFRSRVRGFANVARATSRKPRPASVSSTPRYTPEQSHIELAFQLADLSTERLLHAKPLSGA